MKITDNMLEKAKKLPSEKLGAWFEKQTQDIFKEFKENKKFTFLRLYDTKSAGAYLPKQPGDFIACSPNDAYLVECKASKKHTSLASCLSSNVTKEQAVEHFMWHRSGRRSVFLFLSVESGMIEIWNGKAVADHRREGNRLPNPEKTVVRSSWLTQYAYADYYDKLLAKLFFHAEGRF